MYVCMICCMYVFVVLMSEAIYVYGSVVGLCTHTYQVQVWLLSVMPYSHVYLRIRNVVDVVTPGMYICMFDVWSSTVYSVYVILVLSYDRIGVVARHHSYHLFVAFFFSTCALSAPLLLTPLQKLLDEALVSGGTAKADASQAALELEESQKRNRGLEAEVTPQIHARLRVTSEYAKKRGCRGGEGSLFKLQDNNSVPRRGPP